MHLYRAPVALVKQGSLTRQSALLVVAMRYYPRFLPKALIDRYCRELAPDAALFAEFKDKDRATGDHNRAFADVDYERRFSLSLKGEATLKELAEVSVARDVYFLCQCNHDQRCHGDLLLMTARERFGASVSPIPFRYPAYEQRLTEQPLQSPR